MQQKPDIATIIGQDVELHQKGRDLWGRCPFHEDHDPSFKVSTERQRFKCFGCGMSGDVIEYVMKRRGLDFKAAVEILGIRNGEYRPDPEEKEKRKLMEAFRDWCRRETNRLLNEWRVLWEITQGIETEEDMNLRAWAYHDMADLEGKLHVFQRGTDEERYVLYRRAAL